MIVGKVTGSIVSTRKVEELVGNKFLIVEPLDKEIKPMIAVDRVGAGIGEKVLVAFGSAARINQEQMEMAPIDAAIVGIVDEDKE
ncbi:MAG: EutN/CcmL family microcompartment protein [Clostridia bacterium]|nr:EutN/CcmL family microcompartment protein [Clostridia bacterium]